MNVHKSERHIAAHAIAHELTLQALIRDKVTLPNSPQPVTAAAGRVPMLAKNIPSFPHSRSSTTAAKRVSFLPPPQIDSLRRAEPMKEVVRTPYPFSPSLSVPSDDGRVTVSVRRRRRKGERSFPFPTPRNEKEAKEDADDEKFFLTPWKEYKALAGVWPTFGARRLFAGEFYPSLQQDKGDVLKHLGRPALAKEKRENAAWATGSKKQGALDEQPATPGSGDTTLRGHRRLEVA
ncbi:hypothetical protein K470DRAFT_268566 [Piedraia hortae CBS 480.64]|uniref:Uncharacterized protein n=1 Tax=Piedraia hortae CBS 480.64 TaxID=1314780 RepID=A0A6A7C6Y1_9PEZI|nr:hypothetical protein K470DRAFT_268566 [Piedraia hortae CBS 480.64]